MKKFSLLSLLLTSAAAFDNGAQGWKKDDNGNLVLKDGNPVYLDNSGRELVVEQGTITRLNNEAREHRQAKEDAEKKLKAFGDLDPTEAKKAIETVGKLDAKQLIEAGKVDEVKQQITQQFTEQLKEKDTAVNTLQNQINNMLIDGIFSNSDFVRNNIAVPQDMFQASFRNNFKVEDGKVVAVGKDGNRLYSKTRAGEYADAEEALQLLVESHPQKDVILKANTGSGSGNQGGGGNRGTGRNIKRAEFEKMTPVQQAEISSKVRSGEMSLTE